MDPWTTVLAVFRRWYVSLPLAALTVLAALALGSVVEQRYRADASVVLIAPQRPLVNGTRQEPDNPYDARSVGGALYRQLSNADLRASLVTDGYSADYTVGFDDNVSILDIIVDDSTPDGAISTAERLIDETKADLLRLQQSAGVEADSTIRLETVSLSRDATPVDVDRMKLIWPALLIGGAVTVIAPIVADRRHRRLGATTTGLLSPVVTPPPSVGARLDAQPANPDHRRPAERRHNVRDAVTVDRGHRPGGNEAVGAEPGVVTATHAESSQESPPQESPSRSAAPAADDTTGAPVAEGQGELSESGTAAAMSTESPSGPRARPRRSIIDLTESGTFADGPLEAQPPSPAGRGPASSAELRSRQETRVAGTAMRRGRGGALPLAGRLSDHSLFATEPPTATEGVVGGSVEGPAAEDGPAVEDPRQDTQLD